MRLRLGTISTIGALLLAACTSATSPTITTIDPPSSLAVSSTATSLTTTTATAASPSITTRAESEDVREIGGALPDGTPYLVRFDTPVDPTVEGISAAIILDDESEQPRVIGISSYFPEGATEPGLDSLNRYTIRSGQGGVTIAIYDEIADRFDDLEAFLDTHIQPGAESKLPNLELSPPLRWAADDEIPLTMEVMYDGFVVRRGCGDLAVACSEAGAVQVIPENVISTPGRGLPAEPVWIESTAPRPVNSPSYVDPGPLSIRGSHDVLWTGDEMIVWGGADGDRLPNLIDGAAFNPDTSTWRMLAPIPLDNATVTRAIWTDDTMIVVSREATFAYDPEADTWSVLGDGLYPPEYPGFLVWTGDVVVAWTSSGIHEFNPGSGEWIQLPDPGFERGLDRWSAALRVVNGEVYVLSLAPGYCNGRRIVRWTGTEWTALALVDLQSTDYADCSYPNQTGVSRDTLIAWEDDIHYTMAYNPDSDEWAEIDTIPLSGTEGPSGPVKLDNGFLVPQYGEAAIFNSQTNAWIHVVLPGSGEDSEMVWTGEEILMWGWECCYGDGQAGFISMDAWRWTPPAILANG